jgi:serine/threonine protein phosphatase PrpC
MDIKTASISCQGGRDYNEDSVRTLERGNVHAVVVADGLGGHGGGQAASLIVAEGITEAFMRSPQIDAGYVSSLFEQANKEVVKAQTPSIKMKSTAVGLFIIDRAAIWAHAGDSRLYRFENGALKHQTLDHSVSQMAVFAGEITVAQIRFHADRNKVLKVCGGEGFKSEVSPAYTLDPGFHAFLLCTDGFWEYVWETEMEIELAKAAEPLDWLHGMTRRLARRIPKNSDNFTAAAVFANAESEDA